MAKNRYKNTGGSLRSFKGEMKLLSTDNPLIKKVEIWALNDRTNRNGWRYINLREHLSNFRNIPLLTAYLPTGKIGDGHNYDIKRDPRTGEQYASFTAADAERIVGWVPESARVRLEEKEGINWIVVEAALWVWYARELVSQIVRQGDDDPMDVSIETLILDEYYEDGVAVETKYEVLGITILGRGVAPAVAGASIKSLAELSALRDSMSEMRIKAASYERNPKDPDITGDKKGVKNLNYFSKKQLAELEKRFNGYSVISAAQDAEGIYVCLMCNGEAFTYTMSDINETIAPERINAANAVVHVNFAGKTVEIDGAIYSDGLGAEIVKANTRAETAEREHETLKTELDKANSTIKAMEEQENKRRVNAAKDAANAALEAFNANRAEKVESKVLEAITADIESGSFTRLCSESGEWTGDEAVREKVFAACAKAQMEMDRKLADKSKTIFAWDCGKNKQNTGDKDPVRAILDRAGIE